MQFDFQLKYKDSDGDDLLISDDASLTEAVDHARAQGDVALKLQAKFIPRAAAASPGNVGMGAGMGTVDGGVGVGGTATKQEAAPMDPKIVYGAAAAAAVVLTVGAIFMRKR